MIIGTLRDICHAGAMAQYLRSTGKRLFDYPPFAEPFRGEIWENADWLAREHGLGVEYIQGKNFGKGVRIKMILAQRRIPLGETTTCLGALPLLAHAH